MHMSNCKGLLVTAPVLVQCLDESELQAQQSSGIATVDADEHFVQMLLTALKELEAGEILRAWRTDEGNAADEPMQRLRRRA